MILDLTEQEVLAVGSILGHALDTAHDDETRAFLQDIIDNEFQNATEAREVELEALLGGVLDRLTVAK